MSIDQEYDAQADMVDDYDGDEIETNNFIPNFRLPTSDLNITTMRERLVSEARWHQRKGLAERESSKFALRPKCERKG